LIWRWRGRSQSWSSLSPLGHDTAKKIARAVPNRRRCLRRTSMRRWTTNPRRSRVSAPSFKLTMEALDFIIIPVRHPVNLGAIEHVNSTYFCFKAKCACSIAYTFSRTICISLICCATVAEAHQLRLSSFSIALQETTEAQEMYYYLLECSYSPLALAWLSNSARMPSRSSLRRALPGAGPRPRWGLYIDIYGVVCRLAGLNDLLS
jgi:hypothetical protein